ncbi:TPA: phosphotransferase [Legionella pneumophila]
MNSVDKIHKKTTQWALNYLKANSYTLKSLEPKLIQKTPWSYVLEFDTSIGFIYLKHTPKQLALEPFITHILHDEFHASVPKIIAHNPELDCFLMENAGRSLRVILKRNFDASLLCKAIDEFTITQLIVANHLTRFLDIGVPDWRLDKLAHLFGNLLQQKEILMADGLIESEINTLERMLPKIEDLCDKLAAYSIKETIVQCDFHDNNILLDESSGVITFIDLGEIVISHPFFSLVGCLRQTKIHHGISETDIAYQQLMDACFKNFLAHESKINLLEAFKIAQILWIIYEALSQNRLRLACDIDRFIAFQRHGKLRDSLKELINCYALI